MPTRKALAGHSLLCTMKEIYGLKKTDQKTLKAKLFNKDQSGSIHWIPF